MTNDFSWLFVIAAILLVRWLAFEAISERAAKNGDELLFRAPLGLRLLFGFALPGLVYAAGAVALSRGSRDEWWLSAIFIGFAILIAVVWPSDIRISNSAIDERKYLGLLKRSIRWEDVDYVVVDPADDSVEVVSKAGFTVKHTKYHVDRAEFLAKLKDHCRILEPGRALG